jgi:hypothetical protein
MFLQGLEQHALIVLMLGQRAGYSGDGHEVVGLLGLFYRKEFRIQNSECG